MAISGSVNAGWFKDPSVILSWIRCARRLISAAERDSVSSWGGLFLLSVSVIGSTI
jgi:hypothetical protein